MTEPAFDRIIAALEDHGHKVKRSQARPGQQAQARCPAHDDNRPSLSVTKIPQQVLVHCHSGCDIEDVLAALGWSKADLFDNPRGARYDYTDFSGLITRTVYRTPTKDFKQSVHVNGQAPPLYRLPEVVAGVEAGITIYLVEGEKDADALTTVNVVATSAPMGADNFAKVDVSPLRGANVTAVVDRDDKGQRWARQVNDKLHNVAASLAFKQAKVGKDAADHIAAGFGLDDLENLVPDEVEVPARRAKITKASEIRIRPVLWAWAIEGVGRIPAGSLTIAVGREGTGKSSWGVWLAAQITRGTLPGAFYGTPRKVFYVAVEDSWSHTLAPRLHAAGADMDLVYRFEVVSSDDDELMLSLPQDNRLLETEMVAHEVAMVVIDPLMSVLAESIDTHRTREVRFALDPLAKMADRTGSVVLGLAHFNKSSGTDASSLLSGSHAFRDVPRSIFGFARDDSDNTRVMTQTKNNLGRDDLPSFSYAIETAHIETPEGFSETGRFTFTGESERSVADVLRDSRRDVEDRSERDEASAWLIDHLTEVGGELAATDIFKAGQAHGYSKDVLKRAKGHRVRSEKAGFGSGWVWRLAGDQDEESTKGAKSAESETLRSSLPSVLPSEAEAEESDSDGGRLVLFPGSDICADCGEPYDQPGLVSRCRDRHEVAT